MLPSRKAHIHCPDEKGGGGRRTESKRLSATVKEEKGFISWLKDPMLRILGLYEGG